MKAAVAKPGVLRFFSFPSFLSPSLERALAVMKAAGDGGA